MRVERILRGLVSLGLLAALAIPFASAKSYPSPARQTAGKEKGMHDKLQVALDSLNLSDDQKAKVKDILADAKTKRQAVVTDTSLNEEQKKAKMKELHEAMVAKLNEVLTPEQQAELKKKMTPEKEKPPERP